MKKQTSKRYKKVFKLYNELMEVNSHPGRVVEKISDETMLARSTIYRILKSQKEKSVPK